MHYEVIAFVNDILIAYVCQMCAICWQRCKVIDMYCDFSGIQKEHG